MTNKTTAKPIAKRVAVTVYMSQDLLECILKSYAIALLDGYTGTKQAYITQLLKNALTTIEKEV